MLDPIVNSDPGDETDAPEFPPYVDNFLIEEDGTVVAVGWSPEEDVSEAI